MKRRLSCSPSPGYEESGSSTVDWIADCGPGILSCWREPRRRLTFLDWLCPHNCPGDNRLAEVGLFRIPFFRSVAAWELRAPDAEEAP